MFLPNSTGADREQIIHDRSPVNHTASIKAPMLILSGADDNIVPPNQAHMLADKIRSSGGTVEVAVYPGEGHIFSKGSTLEDMEVRRESWFRMFLVGEV
jgi:dipeptidyl aminopeptidase/acylaminoacyl peptidase